MFILKKEKISNIETEILSNEKKSQVQILILPGNPGVGTLYIEFAEELYKKLDKNVGIHIITYAGFGKENSGKVYGLQEELEHKMGVFQSLSKDWNPNNRIHIIGHSIGSWLGIELQKYYSSHYSIYSHLLFPFIIKTNSNNQNNYKNVLTNQDFARLANLLFKVIQKFPKNSISVLLKIFYSHGSEKARNIIQENLMENKGIIQSIFHLAKDEFSTLKEEFDYDYFNKFSDNIFLYYCHDDLWAPISQLESLKSLIPNLSTSIIPMVTHDFCVNTSQSALIAETISEKIISVGREFN